MAWTDELNDQQIAQIRNLIARAGAVDRTAPVSEDALRALPGDSGIMHRVETNADDSVIGYAQKRIGQGAHPDMAEVVVDPESRGHGLGTGLVVDALGVGAPGAQVWAHGDLPPARAVARRLGLIGARELVQMRRALDVPPLPDVVLPSGVSIRTYAGPEDDGEIVRVNAAAFAWHPEQGDMSAADFTDRTAEAWFDPSGLFLAFADDDPHTLLGFHWTKVHPAEAESEPIDPAGAGSGPIGEVYVVGISPEAQGRGLGRTLTLAGLHHLRNLQLSAVLLYVEGDNAAALRTYEGLGFDRFHVDMAYSYSKT